MNRGSIRCSRGSIPAIGRSGRLGVLERWCGGHGRPHGGVEHQCNGLILFLLDWSTLCVCNPATRRWIKLPKRPNEAGYTAAHLVFDPMVSLHYEVIAFSDAPRMPRIRVKPGMDKKRPSSQWQGLSLLEHKYQEASESQPMPEWELKHKADIGPSILQHYMRQGRRNEEIETSWSLDCGEEGLDDPLGCGWDSSDESAICVEGKGEIDNGYRWCDVSHCMDLLGYHPSKEIVFLGDHFEGFAYYIGTSKLQYLGSIYPLRGSHRQVAATHESFIYTPCIDDLLPDQKRNTTRGLAIAHTGGIGTDQIKGSVQWPPSLYVAHVFSSRTGRWEERTYVREDDAAVTLLDVWSDPWGDDSETLSHTAPRCNAVCWRGAFYLHCRGGFVMRLSLLEHKYKVIKTPNIDNRFTKPRLDIDKYLRRESEYTSKEQCLRSFQMDRKFVDSVRPYMHFGKSEHGIYYTALCWCQLQVWVLREVSESRPLAEWELKHKADIESSFQQYYTTSRKDRKETQMSWSLDRGKEGSDHHPVECGWESSDDSCISVEGEDEVHSGDRTYDIMLRIDFLGCHPNKDIAFLGNYFDGFAYNLGTSNLQYLGTFDPVGCCHYLVAAMHESFIYTPCMDDLLPEQKRNTRHGQEEVDIDEDKDIEEVENEETTCKTWK
ncbi:hypothetical protein HU200_016386 [Digitaria exilis]|uniref:Uncharacterized protein n=1 Tax=Digitaria exilis TaxID=1010633 RepID=A0A835F862_9POAL|nr:hypothetical protein HU200_016386 [Digitaria exilis]